jgi:hypothetical protein
MSQLFQRFMPLVAVLAILPGLVLAQTPEEKALRSYSLDMTKLNKAAAVSERIAAMVQANPSLATKYEGEASKADESLDQTIKSLEKIPELSNAVRAEGFTMRDYLMTTLVMAYGAAYREMTKVDPKAEVPDGLSPSNAKFIDQHAAEIQKVQARMDAAQKKIDAASKKAKR